jgi:hypothetical protein
MLSSELSTWLAAALPAGGSHYDISERLRQSAPTESSDEHRLLIAAFGYHLLDRSQTESRDREEGPYGPMMESSDGRFPPRLSDIDQDGLDLWAAAYEAVDEPGSRSRLGDLLWVRKAGDRPDQFARGAGAAMVELSRDRAWEVMEQTDALTRALEISREVSDGDFQQQVVERTLEAVDQELDLTAERPGVSLRLLESLMSLPPLERPPELARLLDRSAEVYGSDPWQADTIIDLKGQLLADEELMQLRRAQVELWREQAARATGIVRVSHLEHALEIARTFGLTDQAQSLLVEIQDIRDDELDLKAISAEVQVSNAEVERYVSAFLEPQTLDAGLVVFGSHGPPGGEPERLTEDVRRQMKTTPLQFLVTKIVLDPDHGVTIFRATDEESHLRAALAQQRQFAARIWSVFALDVLMRMKERYGNPSHDELVAAFTGDVIDEPLADRFARALELLWEGYPDESAHLAAPRLETALRELARKVGLPVIKEPRGGKAGGVRTLGVLLDGMTGVFPSHGWHAYLRSLLTDPLGSNLRNVVAHGLRTSVAAQDAALLLHAACFLRALRVTPQNPDTSGGD